MAGIDDVTPEVRIEGGDQVLAEFEKMAASAVDSFAKIAKAAENMNQVGQHIEEGVEVGKKALAELAIIGAEAFSKIIDAAMSGDFGPLIGQFSKVGQAIVETTQRAIEFVEAQASVMETMNSLAEATGMTLSQIEALKDAFASVGISTNGFERSIGRLAITIGNEWSQIQASVRTSADQQTGAMLHLQDTAFAVQKSYNNLSEALDNSMRSAAHSALGIQSSSLGLRQAMNELTDFAAKSQQNSLSIEGAALNLRRAELNLKKDSSPYHFDTSAEEKSIKLDSDRLAVEEAKARMQEASKKKQREGLELEELNLKVAKAKQEAEDAVHKSIEESVKASERLRDAQAGIAKAALANREAQEKSHELDLKDIPAIAREIENVANGYKKWDEVINHTEISAQTLTKAVVLATSKASGSAPPQALDVFKEMVQLFAKMGDGADAAQKKMEIVQHTMGAGFRSGQASAAQIVAVINRFGKDADGAQVAMEKLFESTDKFAKVKFGGIDLEASKTSLLEFNSSFSRLEALLDQVKGRFAAILAEPLTKLFNSMRESLEDDDGALRKFADGAATAAQWVVKLIESFAESDSLSAFGSLLGRIFSLVGDLGEAFNQLLGGLLRLVGFDGPSQFFDKMTYGINILKLSIDGLRLILSGLIIIIGEAAAAADKLKSMLPGQKSKTFEQAEADSPILQSGRRMAEDVKKDIDRDMKSLDDAGKRLSENADSEKKASDKHDSASQKHSTAADKHDKASEKHSSAADKFEKASDKGDAAAGKLDNAGTKLGEAADKLVAAAASLTGGGATRKADGGYISGPGTSTSDSIPALLSDGEYVMRAASVAQYGKSFFDAVNKGVAKFSEGGFVDSGMHRDKFGQYRGPIKVGKASLGDALVDTGASFLAISQSMAREGGIDLSQGEKQPMSTAGGIVDTIMTQIPVAIHGISRTLQGSVFPDDMLREALVGMNFLNSLTDFAMTKSSLLLQAASGGHIRGAGTATSDSIPARLSDGEYVVRAAAVSQYGVPLFDALNNLALGGGARFAMGGAVGARPASMSSSMTGGPQSTINLTIDGNHFNGMKAPDAVATKLKSYAVSRQESSAQKLPTWMR